jgi:hypothetical protein
MVIDEPRLAVAPKDHISVGVDLLNPSKFSGLETQQLRLHGLCHEDHSPN